MLNEYFCNNEDDDGIIVCFNQSSDKSKNAHGNNSCTEPQKLD